MCPCDYKLYPKDWPQIRARILARAGDKCERCMAPNHAEIVRDASGWKLYDRLTPGQRFDYNYKSVRIVLTIAHVDHARPATDGNLRAWCQMCHLRYDAKYHQAHRKETLKAKRTSPLFDLSMCPRCSRPQPDPDGLGVLHCTGCGYCVHPNEQDGICGFCGRATVDKQGRGRGPGT